MGFIIRGFIWDIPILFGALEAGPGKLSLLHGTRKVSPSAKISDLELADDDFLCLIKRATGSYTSWEEDRPLEADCMVKCVLLGAASAGKTSWLQAVCREDIGDSYRATIGVDFKMKRLKSEEGTKIKLQLWDVAGQPRFRPNTRVCLNGASGILGFFSLAKRDPGCLLRNLVQVTPIGLYSEQDDCLISLLLEIL